MKVKITDEMVESILKSYGPTAFYVDPRLPDSHPKSMKGRLRSALDAALNPPAEPTVIVTTEMLKAGGDANREYWVGEPKDGDRYDGPPGALAAIYRAMRALEPKVEMICPTCSGPGYPVNLVCRDYLGNPIPSIIRMARYRGELMVRLRYHRRAGDPE